MFTVMAYVIQHRESQVEASCFVLDNHGPRQKHPYKTLAQVRLSRGSFLPARRPALGSQRKQTVGLLNHLRARMTQMMKRCQGEHPDILGKSRSRATNGSRSDLDRPACVYSQHFWRAMDWEPGSWVPNREPRVVAETDRSLIVSNV